MPRCFSLRTRQLYSVFFNLKATCETFIAKTNDLIEEQMHIHWVNTYVRIVNSLQCFYRNPPFTETDISRYNSKLLTGLEYCYLRK